MIVIHHPRGHAMGVSSVRILEKIDQILTVKHCIHKIWNVVSIQNKMSIHVHPKSLKCQSCIICEHKD